MREHTVLVAFCVYGDSMDDAQRRLMRQLPSPDHPGVDGIDSWWIAEDERYDRSDNDSAVFVPMGSQQWWEDYVRLLSEGGKCINTFRPAPPEDNDG